MKKTKATTLLLAAGILATTMAGSIPVYAKTTVNKNMLMDTTKKVTTWKSKVTAQAPDSAQIVDQVKYQVVMPEDEYEEKIENNESEASEDIVIQAQYEDGTVNFLAEESEEADDGNVAVFGSKTDETAGVVLPLNASTRIEKVMTTDAADSNFIDTGDIVEGPDGNGYEIIGSDADEDITTGTFTYELDPVKDTVKYVKKFYTLKKKVIKKTVKKNGKKKTKKIVEYQVTLPKNKYSKTIKKGQRLYLNVKGSKNKDLAQLKVSAVKKNKNGKIKVTGKLLKLS